MVTAGTMANSSLVIQVLLYVSGRKLRDLDTFSKSDPMCFMYEHTGLRGSKNQWRKIGQTEQVKNSLNPDFRTSFTMPYFFEKVQNLKFVIIDGDGSGDYETIGEVFCSMGNIMGARAQMWQGNLSYFGADDRGQIIVRTEAIKDSNEAIKMQMRVQNPNNEGGGCLGLCKDKYAYRFEI